MAGTGEIKHPGWTKTSTAALQLILIYQGLEEENLDQKSPGPSGWGLSSRPAPRSLLKTNNKLNRNEFADTEQMYKYLKNCIHETTKEALGEKEANKRRTKIFWNAEIEKERQNRKKLFVKWLSTKDHNDKLQ
jgi:hypothetical protein